MKLAYSILLSLRVDVLIMVELCSKCVNNTGCKPYHKRFEGFGEVAGTTSKEE